MPTNDSPRSVLLAILVPMLATFAAFRLYLHFVNPDSDLFIAGYNVHHLYTGVMVVIPAAFVLAFGTRSVLYRRAAQAALGSGSGLVLDEVIYLIATDGSNAAYLSSISVWGGVTFVAIATGLLLLLYARDAGAARSRRS
jgi:hypothetical protein